MHSLQQSIENERNNPPVGSVPGSYMHNTIQYYPTSSQAQIDRYGRPLYPENINKLVVPNEYKRPSSAPLTPVEPKKIGRRFRRSSSVEEPNPDTVAMHENELRRNNGLSRYEHTSQNEVCVRTCDGKMTASDPNRIIVSSHYSGFDGSIMSHSKPISYNYRHEFDSKRIKTERNEIPDSNEISYRPYMDVHHPYSNIKKNLTERFKAEEDIGRSSFNPSSAALSSFHSGASSRPSDNYFNYGQYPPSQQDYYSKINVPHSRGMDSSFRVPYPSHSESLSSRPHHNEQLPVRPNLNDPSHHNDAVSRQRKADQDASVQAMNTYLEMMANVHQAGNAPDGIFVRSREVLIQKTNPTGVHNQISHSLTESRHSHPRDFQEKHPGDTQTTARYPHLEFHEKGMNSQSSAIRYPPHNIREKAEHSVIRGGMESSDVSSHNIHNLPRPMNPPWPTVAPGEIPSHEKDQKRNYFLPPPTNPIDCGCPFPKRHLGGECKLRNESFKPGEGDHPDHSRFIDIRNNPGQYDVPNPFENPQYRRPEKVHPPELMYHDKTHNEYINTPPPRGVKEMVTPPLLKNEALRPDNTTSPSNIKKTPRPGPIVIPPTINNKAIYSTPCPIGRPTVTLGLPHSIYTPPPMLSPKSIFFNPPLSFQRVYTPASTGYVCQTPRRVSLIDKQHETPVPPASAETVEKQVSVESVPEPKINVGPQFQATVPNVSDKSEAHKDVHRAGLMWSPLKEDKHKTTEVTEYLEMACSLALYGGGANKEYALHILQRTRGNVKEAIRLLLSRRHILRADDPNADYHYSGSTRWNAKERLAFRTAFRSKGKIFADIKKEIGTKSVHLCVEFYYLWKAKHPESFRVRTRTVEAESEQDEDEVPPTPTAAVAPLSTLREPVFECDYPDCLARFISRQALNGHIRVHGGSHTKTPDSRRPPKEKAANLSSPKAGLEGSAMNSPPKRKKPANTQPALAGDGTPMQFQCRVCGRVFSKVKSRSAHMKTHVKKDENNKTIKPPKNKGPVEIQPLHKPFDMLMHAAQNVANSYETPNISSNIPMHNTQPIFNPSVDNTKPLFNPPVDNPKAMFNPPADDSSPLFNPTVDKNRIPFTTSMENSRLPFNPPEENAKPSFKPPTENTTSLFDHLVENQKATFEQTVVSSKPPFDNNNNNNSISSMSPST